MNNSNNNFEKVSFNKVRYIELLKKEKTLKNQSRSMNEENPDETAEFWSYVLLLESQIYYNGKNEYLSLMKEYITNNAGEAGAKMFIWDFMSLFKEHVQFMKTLEEEILENNVEKLDTFSIDPKSTEFNDLIHDVFGWCEFATFDPEDPHTITFDQFRKEIEKTYLRIKKLLEE